MHKGRILNGDRAHTTVTSAACQYGSLPGRWENVKGYKHKEWQTYSQSCQLTDRLSERGVKLDKKDQSSNATRKLYILEYGDSVDRLLLEDLCAIGKGKRTDCWIAPGRASLHIIPAAPEIAERAWPELSSLCSYAVTHDAGDPYSYCMNACELPTMTIVRQHMWGVAHEGPYHLSKTGSPQDRVTHVRRFHQSVLFICAPFISHAQHFKIILVLPAHVDS